MNHHGNWWKTTHKSMKTNTNLVFPFALCSSIYEPTNFPHSKMQNGKPKKTFRQEKRHLQCHWPREAQWPLQEAPQTQPITRCVFSLLEGKACAVILFF